jgi:hypothetical protein
VNPRPGSALPPKADMQTSGHNVRKVPILLKNSSSKHFRYIAENAIPRPS